MFKRIRLSTKPGFDWYLLGGAIFLLLLGLLIVYDSSSAGALNRYGDQYRFLKSQFLWVLLGSLGGFLFYILDYRWLKKLSLPLLISVIFLLVLVLLPTPLSREMRGSQSWIGIALPSSVPILGGEIGFQPSEFAKLALIIWLATLFAGRQGRASPGAGRRAGAKERSSPSFWAFFIPTSLVAGLIAIENDLGNALIIAAVGWACFFFAQARSRHLILALLIFAAAGGALGLQSSTFLERMKVFLNPDYDPQGAGYQINQVEITLGSGGFWGLGIGRSLQKYGYIPAIQTDAIFAVIGEEFGFFGATLVIAVFSFLIYRGFLVAGRAPDEFGRVLAAGITSWVAIQILLNLGAITRIVPLTGVTLPLLSYGGSSLVALLFAFGILLNVSRNTISGRSAK